MPLVINDPETIAAIERLAAERGTTEELVVKSMLPSTADPGPVQSPSEAEIQSRIQDILALAEEFRAHLTEPLCAADIDELLYDEHGMPK